MRSPLIGFVPVVVVCVVLGSVLGGASGCSETPPTPPTACVPGASIACAGAGGCSGSQVCNAEGTAYLSCDCGTAGDGGSNADGGTQQDGGLNEDGGVNEDGGTPADVCNPVAMTGCKSGQGCGWVRNEDGTTGRFECSVRGTATQLQPCTVDVAGVDDCASGLICLNGVCKEVCDPAGAPTCEVDFACVAYVGLSDPDAGTNWGACDPTCDPLTQVRPFDGAEDCGSVDGGILYGCFGEPGASFTCTPAPNPQRKHRDPAAVGGVVYLNACAPGYLPLLKASSVDATPICVALCRPEESYTGHADNLQGLSPYSCPEKGATGATEECRFFSNLEPVPTASPGNTVGYCLDYTKYAYDDDLDPETPPVPMPSCADLPNVDTDADGIPQHVEFGCGPAAIP